MSIQSVITIWTTVAQLIPVIDQTIKGIEAALPEGTKGAVKLEAARQSLAAVFATAEGLVGTFEAAWPAISGIIAALVSAYNTIGIFKKSVAG